MKIKLLLPLLLTFCFAQQVVTKTFMHDGSSRSYDLYLPKNYNPQQAVPLLFNFHGRGSNKQQQLFYGDFRPIADTAQFIICLPQGLNYQGSSHWNVGGFTQGSSVDDVDFTDSVLVRIKQEYLIDEERVYSTGMSNGGF